MPKPQWLIDRENENKRTNREPDMCCDCTFFGAFVRETKHKRKDWCEVHECEIHPGCLNTKYSIGCNNFLNKTTV